MDRWEESYEGKPPWDVGYPQPDIVKLVRDGGIKPGRVLDAGCGTGENAVFLAENGCSVAAIDIARHAIEIAKEKSVKRHVKVDFLVCNALTLDSCFGAGEFDTVIDSGLFHTLAYEERPVFVKQVHKVLKDGGKYFMMCFSDKQPGKWGPRRVSKEEIERALTPLFKINYIKDAAFASLTRGGGPKAYLVSASK
jgi:ubiquinone/menaquinone biosynthesis C-methylase UbiE